MRLLLGGLVLLAAVAATAQASAMGPGTRFPVVPVHPLHRGSQHGGRGQSPPVAMLGGIVEGIGNSLNRLKEGTKDLMGNAKKLGSLKKRWHSGEVLSFEEYNLMQRTSGDLAKFVGLALFTLSKPEFTPFLCSFFPQVVPSTYLTSDEKLQRCQQKNFQRVRAVVQHLMNLQQEAVAPHRKETDRMRHLKTMESLMVARGKGPEAALKQAAAAPNVIFTEKAKATDRKGRPKADLAKVPRPFLAAVANSVGMVNRFVPAVGLRAMLSDYLFKIAESDEVLLATDVDKLGRDDLVDACSQRALSLGDGTAAGMRANLKGYLKLVSKPPVTAPKDAAAAGGDAALNENNLRFALLGLNMVGLVREAKENIALRSLFGSSR